MAQRLAEGEVEEMVIATNPTVEGEATAHYLAQLARAGGVKPTRLAHGVPLGGESALPDLGPGHADGRALARVAYNTDAWAPPLQEAARARDELYGSLTQGNDGAMSVDNVGERGGAGGDGGSPSSSPPRQQQQPPLPPAAPPSSSSATPPTTPPSPSTLPPMRSFTFLRLTPSMLEPPISDEWRAFVRRMRGGGGNSGGSSNGNGNSGSVAAVSEGGGGAMLS